MNKSILFVLYAGFSVLFSGTGCKSMRDYGYARPYKFGDQKFVSHDYSSRAFRARYDALLTNMPPNLEGAKAERNAILHELMYMIEASHGEFERNSRAWKSAADFLTDVAVLGVNGAGTLVGGEATKSILHVVSGGLTGSQLALNKRLFAEQAVETIQAQMRASMKERKAQIISNMTNAATVYPLEMGLSDIVNYYYDGTFARAVQNMLQDAKEHERAAGTNIVRALERAGAAKANP